MWQRNEHQQFLEMFTNALNGDEAEVQKIRHCWFFVSKANLDLHQKMEDQCFFPLLDAAFDETGKEALKALESDHANLASKLERLNEKFEGDASLKELEPSVKEFISEYGAHIDREEEVIIPLVKEQLDESKQREIGLKVRDFVKNTEFAKFNLLMFRDTALSVPEEARLWESTMPWFLRKVLLPIFGMIDSHYSEYCSLFAQY